MDILQDTMTFEDFLLLDGGNEWVDGKVVPLAAVDLRHDRLVTWLVRLVGDFVEIRELGSIHKEPFVMRAAPTLPGRAPDLMFLARAHQSRLLPSHLDGPADVAVEVISPGSQARDRGEKFYEYEQGGVPEYWLIDPVRRQTEFYSLAKGLYVALPLQDGVFSSQVLPGFWLRESWLWQEPLPPVRQVLGELGL